MNAAVTFIQHPLALSRAEDNEWYLVFKADTELALIMNSTAHFIFDHCTGRDIRAIVEAVAEHYEFNDTAVSPDTLYDIVSGHVAAMQTLGLIVGSELVTR